MEGLKCPACQAPVKLSYVIADKDRTTWCFCKCGSVFHQKKLEQDYWIKEYHPKYKDWKGIKERYEYIERIYLPIAEELTYGRSFLDVGFGLDFHICNLAKRGWRTTGIDLYVDGYIKDDFETYDFKDDKFDLINMGNVLGAFKEPIRAIYKAWNLLKSDGFLLIMSPDGEFIYEKGMFGFGNWQWEENWVIFSHRQLLKILESLNFDIILKHKNTQKRMLGWNYHHTLAQKRGDYGETNVKSR